MKRLRFISGNDHKISECCEILNSQTIEVSGVKIKINEIQTEDSEALVKDKLIKAFSKIGKPLFVEQTGLYIEELNGLPAGLTQTFWDKLQADGFVKMFSGFENKKLTAKTMVGYCDGRSFHFFEGQVSGHVPEEPKGSKDFQWDCVFIPDGEEKTFAEMSSERKNSISMRRLALEGFKKFLET